MQLSIITSTSIVALAAAALLAGGASAAPNLNSSRSNIYKLDAGNPDAEKQCVDEGGRVKDGTCVLPEGPPQPAEATTVKSSKSNSSERTGDTGGGSPQPAGSANLNLSKSNINRTGDTPQPAEATTIKTTKSNTFKTGCPAGQHMNAETNECTAEKAASPTPQ